MNNFFVISKKEMIVVNCFNRQCFLGYLGALNVDWEHNRIERAYKCLCETKSEVKA